MRQPASPAAVTSRSKRRRSRGVLVALPEQAVRVNADALAPDAVGRGLELAGAVVEDAGGLLVAREHDADGAARNGVAVVAGAGDLSHVGVRATFSSIGAAIAVSARLVVAHQQHADPHEAVAEDDGGE